MLFFSHVKDKGKRIPVQALRVPVGWDSQTSRPASYKGGKFVRPTHRSSFPQEIFLVLTYFRGWVDPRATVRPEGLCQWKISVTLSRIRDIHTCRAVPEPTAPPHDLFCYVLWIIQNCVYYSRGKTQPNFKSLWETYVYSILTFNIHS